MAKCPAHPLLTRAGGVVGEGGVGEAVAIRGAPYAARQHAVVPRDLQLRVAQDDWERNDFHERVRA